MKQLACALGALVVAATAMTLAVYGALRLLPFLVAVHAWVAPACGLFVAIGLSVAGWKMRRTGSREDRSLTPLTRAPLPTTRMVEGRLPRQ